MPEVVDNYAYSLARIDWDLFGTLTFTKSVPPTKRAFGMAWAHFYQAAKLVNRPYGQLLIALRPELGELFGRFHFHYLLGGTRTSNAITLAHTLNISGRVFRVSVRSQEFGHMTTRKLVWHTAPSVCPTERLGRTSMN